MPTQLQVKLRETWEITYLKAKKLETRYLETYLDVSKKKKFTIDILKAEEQHKK